MGHAGEPSVEEILASIKKVIARDNRIVPETRVNPPLSSAPQSYEDEIFDLSQATELTEEPAGESPLLTEAARSSMRESLAALSVMAQPPAAPQIVRSGETSLEGMVRDLLRPALADWLDKNLPPLVESMVAAEIARIVGKKA